MDNEEDVIKVRLIHTIYTDNATTFSILCYLSNGKRAVVKYYNNQQGNVILTYEYAKRFREENPKAIFKITKNKEQDFYELCDYIGSFTRIIPIPW